MVGEYCKSFNKKFFVLFIYLFIYLIYFLAALGLRCCEWAFSSLNYHEENTLTKINLGLSLREYRVQNKIRCMSMS